MKKRLMVICLLLNLNFIFGNDFVKIAYLKNQKDTDSLYLRKDEEVAPYDDDSKNIMLFSPNGELFIHCIDLNKILKFNSNSKKFEFLQKTDFLESCKIECLVDVGKSWFLFCGALGRFKIFDSNFSLKASIRMLNWDFYLDNNISENYYDEENDILFFRDKQKKIHSIIHPCLDDSENRKNYKNPKETIMLINNDSRYEIKNLSIDEKDNLVVKGQRKYWGDTQVINKIRYQTMSNKVNVWHTSGKKEIFLTDPHNEEQIESIAVHPSGDIFVLRINWNTNTHNLYYVENTWDPEWRAQWYKDHPDAM